jgi:hypothetical protein
MGRSTQWLTETANDGDSMGRPRRDVGQRVHGGPSCRVVVERNVGTTAAWRQRMSDQEFWEKVLGDAAWLFYGELQDVLPDFLEDVLEKPFDEWGFDRDMERDFAVAYWLLISELVRLDLYEYGTSPRGGWLTDKGKRFVRIFKEKMAAGKNPFDNYGAEESQ